MPGVLKFNLDYINKIYENNIDTKFEFIQNELQNFLSGPSNLKQIASLNSVPIVNLKSGELVHFRCMVQDILMPEIFLGKYQVHNLETNQILFKNGLFQDMIHQKANEEINLDSDANVNMDRQIICCTLVPYENDWVSMKFSENYLREDYEDNTNSLYLSKRKMVNNIKNEDETDIKKIKFNDDTSVAAFNEQKKILEKQILVIVKVYKMDLEIKLNEVLDVYGIFSHDQLKQIGMDMNEVDEDMEWENNSFTSEPIIHAICINKLIHTCPLPLINFDDDFKNKILIIRQEFSSILEKLLFSDKFASEYLLCNLLSSIYLRKDISILGKFSLNLSQFLKEENYINNFYQILSLFLTNSNLIKMSLSNMNDISFVPHKDYKLNRLMTSMLQISNGTHLFLDETALSPGTLNTNGVNNVRSLNDILTWQKLDYDFQFYQHSFDTDIPVLIISEGRTLLKADCHVPLIKYDSNFNPKLALNEVRSNLTDQLLDKIRAYIVTTRQLKCEIGVEVQKMIEDDFVELRKNGNITPDDLHLLIVLARLLSNSYGLQEISSDVWKMALKYEVERRERLKT